MDAPQIEAEQLAPSLWRAARLGAAFSAAVGCLEIARLLLEGAPRYNTHALGVVLAGLAAYALLGLLLGLLCGTAAWILWRRPTFLAASASTCAGVGTFAAVASFVLLSSVGAAFLVPAALCCTLGALVLRELLAWMGRATRPLPWLLLGALALLVGGTTFLVRGGRSSGAPAQGTPTRTGPNVLLVTIDTLRRDHVGCYGAPDAKTPAIDALALESVRFEDATSQANTTGPSHTTMLTGLYPDDHGARRNAIPIAHGVPTLPEFLAAEGYQTAGVVSGFTLKHEAVGLAPRFEYYDDDFMAWRWLPEAAARLRVFRVAIQVAGGRGVRVMRMDRPAVETVDSALRWLEQRDAGRPFFLWTHFFDPHCPYEPPDEFAALHDEGARAGAGSNWYRLGTPERRKLVDDPREVARMHALYRGEISYVDAQLARLLGALRERGLYEDTLVVLTADHGEGLGEHGYWFDHGTYLYDGELSVPLLVRFPRGAHGGTSVGQQVRLLDLTPTVLDVLGLEPPKGLAGASLVDTLSEREAAPRPSFAVGELSGELSGYDLDGRLLSLRSQGHKWIWTSDHWFDSVRVPERFELYDLGQDPKETRDMAQEFVSRPPEDQAGAALREMKAHLELWRAATAVPLRSPPISAEVRRALQSIGY